MQEIENGCLGIWEQLTDYLLCEGDIDTLPELSVKDRKRYEYNQWKWSWSTKSCTIFAAAGMLSDLKNYEFSEAQLREMDNMSYERGRLKDQWWYVQSAVKCVADRWNNSELCEKYWKVAYYRISKYDTATIQWALDKYYTLDTNYSGNQTYNRDYKADWVLDGTDFWAATYWHSIGIIWENGTRSVKDNYYWRQYNIYALKNNISAIKCYWSFLYIYVDVDNLERVKKLNKIRTLILAWIPINSDLWHESGSDYHKNKLHDMNDFYREWLDYIDNELKELN